MDDLISRAAAIKAFTGKPPEYYHADYIASELRCLPAVDAVPVVRCRDCKHYDEGPSGDVMICYHRGMRWPDPNDYCSKGERRTT